MVLFPTLESVLTVQNHHSIGYSSLTPGPQRAKKKFTEQKCKNINLSSRDCRKDGAVLFVLCLEKITFANEEMSLGFTK